MRIKSTLRFDSLDVARKGYLELAALPRTRAQAGAEGGGPRGRRR